MMHEFRRAKRRKAPDTILVTDAMTERVIGRIGNLSETGMLLMLNAHLVDDALYQLRFTLRDGGNGQQVDVGAHLLWMDRASAPTQVWAGFRFIAVSEAQARRLRSWIDAPGSHYE
ncbi:PilZ domain-containing protein [Luteimonas kalidii]|jgi:c-di-GMP-binding flagellar brake protein YcgR|uniref:PilZ domain-containing protein n=1 Tax=Luteimonas kalidii TaxID=3042025 RepID=A0ABT6JXU6_9GAMM|nr:PilZ domain-containing protein [Luteimonas kalidii]MDH5835520.1 PilZ domain-containing protein [Luteimonas kalidii]